ncbi:MAG: hypothetical protein CSA49_03870 [Gammaproteobacteria bacterium]|nr:MAG: hypothetical protein CSA49_03870 [Gammaproteobacteria bacterium]
MKQLIALLALMVLPLATLAKVEPPAEDSSIAEAPEVTIIEDGKKRMEIHQINGRVYGIKVIPKKGKPYFLVDQEGTGDFIRNNIDRMEVPEWVLISW